MDYRALRWVADKVKTELSTEPDKSQYSEVMTEYRTLLETGTCQDDVLYASELFEDEIRREVIESALFGEALVEDLTNVFELTPETIAAYSELFFDQSIFRTKLDKVGYIENYPVGVGKELKLRAYSLGAEFIYFKYGNLVPKTVQQRNLVKKMFLSSTYRAMEANFNPINSKITKASLDWAKTMLKAFEAMEKLLKDDGSDSYNLVALLVDKKVPVETELAERTQPEQSVDDSEIV